MYIEPKKIIHPQRLDIIIKYLYIQEYISNKNLKRDNYYKTMYEKHIYERTGGYEPDGSKRSISQYTNKFDNLIESMLDKGYNGEPIPVSEETGLILDGAHRLACCLYFDLEPKVTFVSNKEGLTWNYDWFVKHGFTQDQINNIVQKYCEITNYELVSFLLWSPAKLNWEEIEEQINGSFYILMSREYTFNEENFPAIINDIYSYEAGLKPGSNINKKITDLLKYGPQFRYIVATERQENTNDTVWRKAQTLKASIRSRYDNISQKTKHDYTILHCTDNSEHSKHVITTLLNQNNLDMLQLREGKNLRPEFCGWLQEYQKVTKNKGICREDTCIVGSSVLEILGIRKSTDIDFILNKETRTTKFDKGSHSLSENVDLVKSGYHKTADERQEISDDDIIYNTENHFKYRGVKFAVPSIVRDSKMSVGREKDIKDVHLMDEYLLSLNENERMKCGWELPMWKRKVLILTPRVDLLMRKKVGKAKYSLMKWGGENLPEPIKNNIKKII